MANAGRSAYRPAVTTSNLPLAKATHRLGNALLRRPIGKPASSTCGYVGIESRQCRSIRDHPMNCTVYTIPIGAKDGRDFIPTYTFGPSSQAIAPRQLHRSDSCLAATRKQRRPRCPQWNILKPKRFQPIITSTFFTKMLERSLFRAMRTIQRANAELYHFLPTEPADEPFFDNSPKKLTCQNYH